MLYNAGTKISAGLSESTIIADIDFETYSEAGYIWNEALNKYKAPPNAKTKGLPVIGAAVYSEHPSTEVLCCAYNLKDGVGSRLWKPGDLPPLDLFEHINQGRLIEAWNVSFERWIWVNVCMKKYGWPAVNMWQWRDAMAKAAAYALPRSLAPCGEVMNITHKKDSDGLRLLKKFSMPRDPTQKNPNRRIYLKDDPEDAKRLYIYNLRDIEAESELSERIPDLNPFELQFWLCDQAINHRGVRIDIDAVKNCIAVVEQAHNKYNLRIQQLTNGLVKKASEVAKIRSWLHYQDVPVDELDEETINILLAKDLTESVREVLTIRQLLSSAAVKKLYAMLNQVTQKERLHDLFIFHSARTGRHAGSGVQPQNFPNSGPARFTCNTCNFLTPSGSNCLSCNGIDISSSPLEWDAACVESALATISTQDLGCVEYYHGNAISTVSGCLRGLFIPTEGKDFICSDYSAIEAVVLAALAGEEWRLEVFRTHGMIYETSASKVTGRRLEEYVEFRRFTGKHHADRKLGKVAELASGYQGWVGAWKAFKADEFMSEEEIKQAVLAWRAASPRIVEFWGGQTRGYFPEYYGLEGAAISAVLTPGRGYFVNGIQFICQDDILYCQLLSGRYLTYHKPRLSPSEQKAGTYSLSFEGWNSNQKYGTSNWMRLDTYGGRLCENVVQATARDILANAIINLEASEYPIVLHVHDEIVAEVLEGFGSVEEFEKIMSSMPSWAKDWPVRASGGWRGKRYGK